MRIGYLIIISIWTNLSWGALHLYPICEEMLNPVDALVENIERIRAASAESEDKRVRIANSIKYWGLFASVPIDTLSEIDDKLCSPEFLNRPAIEIIESILVAHHLSLSTLKRTFDPARIVRISIEPLVVDAVKSGNTNTLIIPGNHFEYKKGPAILLTEGSSLRVTITRVIFRMRIKYMDALSLRGVNAKARHSADDGDLAQARWDAMTSVRDHFPDFDDSEDVTVVSFELAPTVH